MRGAQFAPSAPRQARARPPRAVRPVPDPSARASRPETAARRSKPLQIWEKDVRNGHIKRITDNDICSSVIEIMGTNISTTYITCPEDPKQTLGIKLPFLVMIIKNARADRRASSRRARAPSRPRAHAAPRCLPCPRVVRSSKSTSRLR